jgi:hypothetical protein
MDSLLDAAARLVTAGYITYFAILAMTTVWGLQLVVLGVLLALGRRARRRTPDYRPWGQGDALPLQVIYGFVHPLVYLLILRRFWPLEKWTAANVWMEALAWTLFIGIWGARFLVPREREASPVVRTRLKRLVLLGLVCLMAFALRDLFTIWKPNAWDTMRTSADMLLPIWLFLAFMPLYAIPALILNNYRARLARADSRPTGFLLVPRRTTQRLAMGSGAIAVLTLGVFVYRPSDTAARARVIELGQAIETAAARYQVDPRVLAAIVYVSAREVGPFRDQLERFASAVVLEDVGGHLKLAQPFDLSIGAAQITPMTALTALKLCQVSGQSWPISDGHFRSLPDVGPAWRPDSQMLAACQPPTEPVPTGTPDVVAALRRDESNVAFAALILSLYQWQWRNANAEWDISARPEILATLYQIGFARSRPHGAPGSSDFGKRVAETSNAPWLRERFRRAPAAP